ncbi:hypothetical protein [Streptomyces sp. NPDC002758]
MPMTAQLSVGLQGESLVHVNADLTGLAAPQSTAPEVVRGGLAGVGDDEWVDDIVLGRGLFLVDVPASSWDVPASHGKIVTAVFVRQAVAGWA